jgi:hypothetical protein
MGWAQLIWIKLIQEIILEKFQGRNLVFVTGRQNWDRADRFDLRG